nr:MAG TPA: hypothetical protein [Caudoviricetes sp.]
MEYDRYGNPIRRQAEDKYPNRNESRPAPNVLPDTLDDMRRKIEEETRRQERLVWEQRQENKKRLAEQAEQAKRQQEESHNAMAQGKARANAAANPGRSTFGGMPPTLLGGREKPDNTGSQLFSNANKLGGKDPLGGLLALLGM